jgi:cell division protein FtsB
LANLFQKTGNKDSAFLYWRKSYNELDSAHIKMGTERLQRLKANYDYGFQKRIAEQKKKDSIRNRNVAALLGLLFLLSLIAIHAIILHVKRYKEKTRERENQLQQKLAELEDLAMSKNMAERESSLMESESDS